MKEDTNDPGTPTPVPEDNSSPAATGYVGQIIKREREDRNISIAAIAKELRLNPRFIEAIESNNYDLLPGDTYMRVYIRSLCKYLSLNAEVILDRFFKERGVSGDDTLRKDSSTKINIAALREREKPNKTAIIIASAIVILALFSFMALKRGWLSGAAGSPDSVSMAADTTSAGQKDELDSAADLVARAPDSIALDSVPGTVPVNPDQVKNDSLRNAEARASAIKDSVHQAGIRRALVKDSVFKAQEQVKFVKDSIQKALIRSSFLKDSLLKAERRAKSAADSLRKLDRLAYVKDSILAARTRAKFVKDSLIKAEARNVFIKDSLAKARAIKDSTVKADRAKFMRDSIGTAENAGTKPADTLTKKTEAAPAQPESMTLTITATGASAWARVLYDGKPWRRVLRKGQIITLSARDSFNLRTGLLQDVVVTLNGKKVSLPREGVIAVKIDRSGISRWTEETWFATTNKRFP